MATFNSPWLKQPWQSGSASVGYSRPSTQTTAKKPAVQPAKPAVTFNAPARREPSSSRIGTKASLFGGNSPTGLLSERPSANRPAQQRTTTPSTRSSSAPFLSQPATTYTDPRAPYLQFPNKGAADALFNNQAQAQAANDARLAAQSQATKDRLAREAAANNDGFRLFDFDLSDGSDSIWERDRGLLNNLGNFGVNALGATAGGVLGFLGGGTALAGPAAGFGWSGANQGYDFVEDKITGDYERNALIDYGTLGATVAGYTGGALYDSFANNNGGSGNGTTRGSYDPDDVDPNYNFSGQPNNVDDGIPTTRGSYDPDDVDPNYNPAGSVPVGGDNPSPTLPNLFNPANLLPFAAFLPDLFGNNDSDSSSGGGGIAYGTDLTPQYIIDAQKEALERARTLTNSYKDYEGPLTADAAQNELLAANVAADAVGGTADALNDARDMTTGADARYERREGPSSYGSRDDFFDQASLSGYMNPYLEFVQQDTLDNISRENEAIQAALGDQMIQVGAFGGSRTGVAEAENNRNMRQQMLQYINQSNAEAFENARDQFNRDEDRRFAYSEADRNQFNTDLARRLNVGQALGSLASMDSALTQQEINNLMSTGGVLRDIEQAGYTNDFNAYQDFWNRMLGLNAAENAVALGLRSDVLKPPAPEEDPDRLGQILGVLAAGAGLWDTIAGKPSEDDRRD